MNKHAAIDAAMMRCHVATLVWSETGSKHIITMTIPSMFQRLRPSVREGVVFGAASRCRYSCVVKISS